MAAAIPLAAAAFSGAAGASMIAGAATLAGAAATVATVAGYAMVAGAVLTGIGAVTKKGDLMKLGAALSLAGGVAGIGAQVAGGAAAAGGPTAGGAGGTAGGAAGQTAAGQMASSGLDMNAIMGRAMTTAPNAVQPGMSLLEAAGLASAPAMSAAAIAGQTSGVQQAAQGLTTNDVTSWGKKIADGAKEIGPWVKENKELVDVAGKALSGVFGPDAELMDLRKQMADREQALIDRAYNNLNDPVKLRPIRPLGAGG